MKIEREIKGKRRKRKYLTISGLHWTYIVYKMSFILIFSLLALKEKIAFEDCFEDKLVNLLCTPFLFKLLDY